MTRLEARQVCERLLALARRRGVQYGLIFNWYLIERLVHRLEQSGHREELILDGDLLVHALADTPFPLEWRASLLWRPPHAGADLATAINDVCQADGGDQVRFEGAPQVAVSRCASARRQQFEVVVIGGLCGAVCPVSLQICLDEHPEVAASDTSFPRLLEKEDAGRRPQACAPEVFLARRVRALWDSGVAHLHPKVYADLHRLIRAGALKNVLTVSALAAVFRDAKPEVPPGLPLAFSKVALEDSELCDLWSAYQRRVRLPPTELAVVLGDIERYLAPLYEAARAQLRTDPGAGQLG